MKGLAILGGLVLFLALIFGLSYAGLAHYQFFAPKFQEAERKVYEETPSFLQGKEQLLTELRLEYQRARTDGEKENIKAMILNEASTVDLNKLRDRGLRRFVEDLR